MRNIFIFGSKRGGTTLLRMMLNAHSKISIPNESHFLISIFKGGIPLQSHLSKDQVWQVYELIISGGRFDTWKTRKDELKSLFAEISKSDTVTLNYLIDRVFSYEIGSDELIWGDKTPEYADFIHEIRAVFPNSLFIIITRDGRDVNSSLANRSWEGWITYQRSKYWSRIMKKLQTSIDSKCYIIKYEELVIDPERILLDLFAFMELEFEPNVLDYNSSSKFNITKIEKEKGIHEKLYRKPMQSDVYKWKANKKFNVFLFECLSHKQLKIWNYELAYFNTSSLLHRSFRVVYIIFGEIISFSYHSYHLLLSREVKNRLNTFNFWRVLKLYLLK